MTKKQIEGLLNTISGAYKRYARNESAAEKAAELTIWYEMLKDDDPAVVGRVLREHIALSVFPPSIAEIRAGIRRLTLPSAGELFEALVAGGSRALTVSTELIARGERGQADTYRQIPQRGAAFEALPPILQRYVKDPDGLVKWYQDYRHDRDRTEAEFKKQIVKLQESEDVRRLQIGG